VKNALFWLWLKRYAPIAALIILPLLALRLILAAGPLVYGDLPSAQPGVTAINWNSIWGQESLGTNTRQGFNTLRDAIFVAISPNPAAYFFLTFLLPIVLIPVVYYVFLRQMGIQSRAIRLLGALFALANPVVFGDFLNGQTFWIYVLLPWVYLYVSKLFISEEFTWRNVVYLGLALTLAMGALPPIIVPLAAIIVLTVGAALLLKRKSWRLVWSYLLYGGTAVALFVGLSLPYLVAAPAGQDSYAPSSLIADYVHNYAQMNFLNVFRLAGNEGNGQHTLGYNSFALLNAAGFVIFAVVVAAIWRRRSRPDVEPIARTRVLAYGIVLLLTLGGLDFLATNMDMGAKIFSSQWVVGTIRNPTKVFVLLLPVYVLLFGYGLQKIRSLLSRRQGLVFLWVMTLAVTAYGWPVLRGDMGLVYHKASGLAAYKPLTDVVDLALHRLTAARALLIPATHKEELNYQKLSPALGVLRLGGALPHTASFLKEVQQAYDAESPYFFRYLSVAGIGEVAIKKDTAASLAPFSLFSTWETADGVRDFLTGGLGAGHDAGAYTVYKNSQTAPLVYSPTAVSNVPNDNSLHKIAPLLGANQTVVNYAGHEPEFAEYNSNASASPMSRLSGYAQYFDPQLVTVEYYTEGTGSRRRLYLDVINALSGEANTAGVYDVPVTAQLLIINNDKFPLSATKQRANVRAGDQQVAFADLSEVSPGVRFEGEANYPADASLKRSGKADVYGQTKSGDAAEGKKSYLLGSKSHLAYVAKDINAPDAGAEYQIAFEYKNLTGQGPSFNVTQDDKYLKFSDGTLDQIQQWTPYAAYVTPSKAGTLNVNFYTDTDGANKSENLLDALHMYELKRSPAWTVHLDQTAPDAAVTDYTPVAAAGYRGNLLSNASFEQGTTWGDPADATVGLMGAPNFKSYLSPDAHSGQKALALESRNHTAYIVQKVTRFNPNQVYKLSFYYKNTAGSPPSYAIWQSGINKAAPAEALLATSDWRYYEKTFVPTVGATGLEVYLYSPSKGDQTINLFDDITIAAQPPVANYLVRQQPATSSGKDIVESYQRQGLSRLNVDLRPGRGMVVFNESYAKGWRATLVGINAKGKVVGRQALAESKHTIVDSFANGWFVDTAGLPATDYKLELNYAPQDTFVKAGLVSGGIALALVGLGAVMWVRRRRGRA